MNTSNNSLVDNKISLSYLGSFNDEITDKLIGISEFYLEHKSEISELKNKVSFLIAECFQNIIRHSDIFPNKKAINHADFFQLTIFKDSIAIVSCNLIEDKYVSDLETKLIQVNSLQNNELKKLYTELLKNGKFTEKGGAGLGLVEMARKSGLPIKYKFEKVKNGMQQFFLMLQIVNKKKIKKEEVIIGDVVTAYQTFLKEQVLMSYKGDFSKEIVNPILKIIKLNIQKPNSTSLVREKRVVITLIESLENVSKHGKKINGIKEGNLTISSKESNYVIEIGNYINVASHHVFDKTLNEIKKMHVDEINKLYQKRIMETQLADDINCGIGLLEIARKSANNFSYSFIQQQEKELFYLLKVIV